MTPDQFRAWREALGLSKSAAARALGLSRSQVLDYETGQKRGTDRAAPIPRVVELACHALLIDYTGYLLERAAETHQVSGRNYQDG